MDFNLTVVSDAFCLLESGGLEYLGPTELTQYFIRDKYMIQSTIEGQQEFKSILFLDVVC